MAKTIAVLTKELKKLDDNELSSWIELNCFDQRSGVQKLIKSAEKRILKRQKLEKKLVDLADFDKRYGNVAIGLDEAGRGPLAGPVVAAACIIEPSDELLGLDDSKKLSASQRDYFYEVITRRSLYYGVGIVSAETIDKINILEASKLAMQKSLKNADIYYDVVLTDYVFLDNMKKPLHAIVKGDQKSLAIAAASVIAKVTRDRILIELSEKYPEYGFEQHKGYGTKQHYDALKRYGYLPRIHRQTFLKG